MTLSFVRLLVECFTKYCVVGEAIRHFRGLKTFEGGTKVLHHEGRHGDPLSLYLRALCGEGMFYLRMFKDCFIHHKQNIIFISVYLNKGFYLKLNKFVHTYFYNGDML